MYFFEHNFKAMNSYFPVSLNMSLENVCKLLYVVFFIEHIQNLIKAKKKLSRVKISFLSLFVMEYIFFNFKMTFYV